MVVLPVSPEDFAEVPAEPTTEQLASELAALRSELESRLELADRRAELAFIAAQQPTPEPATYVEPIVAAEIPKTAPPRRDLTREEAAALTSQALSTVAATVEGWNAVSPKVVAKIQENPSRFGEILRDQGAIGASAYLTGLTQSEKAAADTRAMKLASQTMVGSSGRTPAPDEYQQRWQEILNADSGRLGL